MAEKRYYRLRDGVGDHTETVDGEVKTFSAGDVVESDKDLTKVFTGKFERATRGDVRKFEAKQQRLEQQRKQEEEAERRRWEDDEDALADAMPAGPVPKKARKTPKSSVETEGDDNESEKVESELGDDVTSEFDVPDGVLVFKKGAYHYVASEDDPDTALNEKGLRADAVEEFAAEY